MILTSEEIETLMALVEHGPLNKRDVPSVIGCNGLLTIKFANYANEHLIEASQTGKNWYLKYFNSARTEPEITKI